MLFDGFCFKSWWTLLCISWSQFCVSGWTLFVYLFTIKIFLCDFEKNLTYCDLILIQRFVIISLIKSSWYINQYLMLEKIQPQTQRQYHWLSRFKIFLNVQTLNDDVCCKSFFFLRVQSCFRLRVCNFPAFSTCHPSLHWAVHSHLWSRCDRLTIYPLHFLAL